MQVTFGSQNKPLTKKWAVIMPLVFILLGVAVILLGAYLTNKSNGWIKTTGKICDIVYDRGTDGKTYYKAYVDYFANGIEQKHILLDAFENYFKVGIEINIKYNPANLTEISYDNTSYFSVIYIVGMVIAAIGILLGIFAIPKAFKKKPEPTI